MRKILGLVLAAMFLTSSAFGAMADTRITGNTVSFSTVVRFTPICSSTPNVVTFNTMINWIRFTNLSTVEDCYVDLRCVDSNGKTGYFTRDSATLLIPAVGRNSPNTVEVRFNTRNIGFASDRSDYSSNGNVSGSNHKIHYVATSDYGDF